MQTRRHTVRLHARLSHAHRISCIFVQKISSIALLLVGGGSRAQLLVVGHGSAQTRTSCERSRAANARFVDDDSICFRLDFMPLL